MHFNLSSRIIKLCNNLNSYTSNVSMFSL
uniref:Uncharacterized protein n=1 Tax=Rhizophora mucronata TaxID=61149 RepID=A0A2P2MZB5_RHIMU